MRNFKAKFRFIHVCNIASRYSTTYLIRLLIFWFSMFQFDYIWILVRLLQIFHAGGTVAVSHGNDLLCRRTYTKGITPSIFQHKFANTVFAEMNAHQKQ